jgi:hypothetical protein
MARVKSLCFAMIMLIGFYYCIVTSFACAQVKPQEVSGKERGARIDIYSIDKKFDLTEVKSNGKLWNPNTGEQKNRWLIAESVLAPNEKWQELWVEFTPSNSGSVVIELRGSDYADLKINHHEVVVDDVKIEGPSLGIKNGSFEEIDSKGNPIGWSWNCPLKDICIKNSAKFQARTGRTGMLVWHGQAVIQTVAVNAGAKYKIIAWFKPYY